MAIEKEEKEGQGVIQIPLEVWFVDANVLAHWILGRGKVLNLLIDNFNLSEEFLKVYIARYKHSINFVDEIIKLRQKGTRDEFFASHLAVNESFSALRDELRSLLLFKGGHPISRWRDSRINPYIKPEHYELVYKQTLKSFDLLLGKAVSFIEEQKPEEKKGKELLECVFLYSFPYKGYENSRCYPFNDSNF